MADKYTFVDDPLKKTPIYEMTEEEFFRIQEANEKVLEIYRFEEMFAMLIDNFYAFNNVIFTYADRARLQSVFSGSYFQKSIDINRAALNFFSTLNMYKDFVGKRIKGFKDNFLKNREIQRCLVMRNYIQHVESFPIVANTSHSKGDLDVTLASVHFRVAAWKLKADRLQGKTQKNFSIFFDINEQIDLYEIINRGMAEIQIIQRKMRELPLYDEYASSKKFLLDIEKKITPNSSHRNLPYYCFESDAGKNPRPCFLAISTIKFIDENISMYGCTSSCANQFITTAPPDFVEKCREKIFSPAMRQKTREQLQKTSKRDDNA